MTGPTSTPPKSCCCNRGEAVEPAEVAGAFAQRREAGGFVPAPLPEVFDRLDEPTRLAAHMERSSMMMGGGRMTYEFDGGKGRVVGSHIQMGGEAFGLSLFVDEVVTERDPPRRKVWRTTGEPRLVIIGAYEMGFELTPERDGTRLQVWIDYDLPRRGWGRRAPALAAFYARWCVRRMVTDAVEHFAHGRSAAA